MVNALQLLTLLFASGSTALPSAMMRDSQSCLSDDAASRLFNSWASVFKDHSIANRVVVTSYKGYSASMVTLEKYCVQNGTYKAAIPVSTPVYTDRSSLQLSQNQDVVIKDVSIAHSCDVVTAHFTMTVAGQDATPVMGTVYMDTIWWPGNDDSRWLQSSRFEFDAYSWIASLQNVQQCVNPRDAPGYSGGIGHIA